MAARTDLYDLGSLRLTAGEGRRVELETSLGSFTFGEDTYATQPDPVPVVLDISRMTGGGYALRIRLSATVEGPCMRCLEQASPRFEVDAREVDQPGGGEELTSPYVEGEQLDIERWAHDAFALTLPQQLICREDCAGLCAICGGNLNTEPHEHEPDRDARWAKLDELKFD
jgi:uncharacterized protein